MELVVFRHAIAEDRDAFAETGQDDGERPLTRAGLRKLEKGARGLRRIVPSLDVVATSPLVRAIETGEVLASVYGVRPTARLPELAPDAEPSQLLPWLRRQRGRARVAVVGHEPHLSRLVEVLLAGRAPPAGFIELGKAGACLLGFDAAPAPGGATLRWLLTPSQLRRLRRT
jgi:phosphohistidine phosphatase